jgi:hypothetical protein
MSKPKKTRLMALCPCCGGEVTRPLKYWFMLVESVGLPIPKISKFYTCEPCSAVMLGSDESEKAKVIRGFTSYIENRDAETSQ